MPINTPILTNDFVTLEPMTVEHASGMFRAAEGDPETFRYFSRGPTPWNVEGMRWYIEKLIATANTRAYTVIDRASDEIVGGTSFCDLREAHRGVEIGWTWYSTSSRGTKVNPACKLLLLTHAFEGGLFGEGVSEGGIRVQLKTDERNTRSRRGIEKLGTVFEGILRDHVIMPDGHLRQTAMYSITRTEWPDVRRALEERLAR